MARPKQYTHNTPTHPPTHTHSIMQTLYSLTPPPAPTPPRVFLLRTRER